MSQIKFWGEYKLSAASARDFREDWKGRERAELKRRGGNSQT
jgi:hypothetical protein